MNFYSAVALLTGAAFWPVLIVVIKFTRFEKVPTKKVVSEFPYI